VILVGASVWIASEPRYEFSKRAGLLPLPGAPPKLILRSHVRAHCGVQKNGLQFGSAMLKWFDNSGAPITTER
jgi:hypothetical protein